MRKAILSIGCFILFFSFTPARAELIKIGLTGLVDYVDDPYNLLENGVHQNDSITGFYIYDSATPDSNPQSHVGEYVYSTAPFGISLTVGGLTFQTDLTNVDFRISVVNGIESGGGGDQYFVGSSNNLFFNNNVYIELLSWQLTDYSYTAISSTELPVVPPNLFAWQSGNDLDILGGLGGTPPCFDEPFDIRGHVTSVYLIPEPATILLLATGALLLKRRSFKKD
jgi:hypothetical protein